MVRIIVFKLMGKLVVKYRYVDASYEFRSYMYSIIIISMIVVGIVFLFNPGLVMWSLVIGGVGVLCAFLVYREDRKQQKMFQEDTPALVLDGCILCYNGETLDLSQMEKAVFDPDVDYKDTILIYSKRKLRPVMSIYTGNMLVDKENLLRLILDGINGTSQNNNFIN